MFDMLAISTSRMICGVLALCILKLIGLTFKGVRGSCYLRWISRHSFDLHTTLAHEPVSKSAMFKWELFSHLQRLMRYSCPYPFTPLRTAFFKVPLPMNRANYVLLGSQAPRYFKYSSKALHVQRSGKKCVLNFLFARSAARYWN